jgi:hypothetical protein
MIQATIKLPELQTKKLWAGMYGGHYDVIVFFKEKPTKTSKDEHNIIDFDWVECIENKDIIVGSMCLGQFYEIFPDADISEHTREDNRPMEIEIPEVFEIEITTVYDEWGHMVTFKFNEDGWI